MSEKTCETCAHRYGFSREYWRCQAYGSYCDVTVQFSHCGGKAGWRLWAPRAPLHTRIIRIFAGSQPPATSAPTTKDTGGEG